MLHIETFTFNPFQENTYLIVNEQNECWIVDPGMYNDEEYEILNRYIANRRLSPRAIINTHAHIDHILGVQHLKTKYNIPFGIHKAEQIVLTNAPVSAMMFGINLSSAPTADFYIDDTSEYQIGNEKLLVFFTPGHSPGSISFYYAPGKWVLGGDVLFHGSIGRTDLPGGNFDTLVNSIKTHLFTLPDDTNIYSGHGLVTTVGNEKLHNPFLNNLT